MNRRSIKAITLISLAFGLSACHDPHHDPYYYGSYITSGDYQYIDYPFDPYETYRIELTTYSGDADVAVYNEYGELIVFSDEYATRTDEVIFTADNSNYQIEVYGNLGSDYDLSIERLPYYETGLDTTTDAVEFNIDRNAFTGDIYSVLASQSFRVNHLYDSISIAPSPDPAWLDVTPTGTVYASTPGDGTMVLVNILETYSPSTTNFAAVRIQAQDYAGKVSVFKYVDVIYRLVN